MNFKLIFVCGQLDQFTSTVMLVVQHLSSLYTKKMSCVAKKKNKVTVELIMP